MNFKNYKKCIGDIQSKYYQECTSKQKSDNQTLDERIEIAKSRAKEVQEAMNQDLESSRNLSKNVSRSVSDDSKGERCLCIVTT